MGNQAWAQLLCLRDPTLFSHVDTHCADVNEWIHQQTPQTPPKVGACRHRSGAHISRAAVSAWPKSPAMVALLGEPRCVTVSRRHLRLYRFFSIQGSRNPFPSEVEFKRCLLGVACITQRNFQKAVFYSMPRAWLAPRVPRKYLWKKGMQREQRLYFTLLGNGRVGMYAVTAVNWRVQVLPFSDAWRGAFTPACLLDVRRGWFRWRVRGCRAGRRATQPSSAHLVLVVLAQRGKKYQTLSVPFLS